MNNILDVACGSKAFYFDKDNPSVTFCDLHPRHMTLCDGRALDVSPDVVADFRDLPFSDNTFNLVIFDPPHLDVGAGWQVDKYGKLDSKTWKKDLSAGFDECFRVLRTSGVLVFKWYEYRISLTDVLSCSPIKPLLGNRRPKQSKTHWVLFIKEKLDAAMSASTPADNSIDNPVLQPVTKHVSCKTANTLSLAI